MVPDLFVGVGIDKTAQTDLEPGYVANAAAAGSLHLFIVGFRKFCVNLIHFLFVVQTAKQHLLAVSDHLGTLHILEIPWTLRSPSSNEVCTRGGL